ncbi:hypothetical protein FNU76_04315 [Chitinimonas arctica]|uniref:Uncharacterized protein n=1 Tax=Chitinimonas arctica TaxID=2594795 RepID=A0A516SBW8_9NEIS|nr:hypothetical protein [Chitinimonas arctica]QDQ25640.1 hypothetical protein FNU76_04315 [Chitinimonas arctica]
MAFQNLNDVQFSADQVVIAISHSDFGGGHIGIGFHTAKAGAKIMHLAWHHRLEMQEIPDFSRKSCWAADVLVIPPLASKQLVAFIRAVATKCPKISYGINFLAARGSFQANASYKPPKGSDGLTCATFVIEVLRAGKVNLINGDTWMPTPQNVSWGNNVCALLEKWADAEHVDAVKRNINGLRIRPFEVAGAAQLGYKKWPVDFQGTQQPASDAENQLPQICPPPSPI